MLMRNARLAGSIDARNATAVTAAAPTPKTQHTYTFAVESLLMSFFTIASTLSSNSKLAVRGL